MPRLRKAVPRYQKHKASGQAVVKINGKTHYLGRHNSKVSRLKYDQIVAEWLANGRSLDVGEKESPSITELFADHGIRWSTPTVEDSFAKLANGSHRD